MTQANNSYTLSDFPLHTIEKIRFRDTDSQGHINNAVYITLIEMGRVDILFDSNYGLEHENTLFMVAHISMNYFKEISWPNEVTIGTKVTHIGNSSFKTEQVIFLEGVPAAQAHTVIVTADKKTRQKKPLSPFAKSALSTLQH